MDEQYRLTYDDSAAPGHYGWKQPARFDQIEKMYRAVKDGNEPASLRQVRKGEETVGRIIKDLDADGRWITTYDGEHLVGQPKFEKGFRYLSSEVFSRNVEALSKAIAALRK